MKPRTALKVIEKVSANLTKETAIKASTVLDTWHHASAARHLAGTMFFPKIDKLPETLIQDSEAAFENQLLRR